MLDDLKYIHDKDAQDALGIAAKQPSQLLHDFGLKPIAANNDIANIVYAGMGGSALAAALSMSWPGYTVPFEILRGYQIPSYVSTNSLFIACSYSGNTEETLTALEQAEKAHARIVVIAGGGKLQAIAEQKNHQFILMPKAEQPRYAVLYNFKALLQLLEPSGLFVHTISAQELKKTAAFLEAQCADLLPEVPAASNPAKQLAKEMMGKSVVIYSGPFLAPAAYKWKISCNENAKNVAWVGTQPEFCHNEFIGWSSHPVQKPYSVIDLIGSYDHPQIQKRFDTSAKLLSGKRPHPFTIRAKGTSAFEQLLWTVMMVDFTTIYLGLLNGVNPSPVDLVEKLKKEL